MYTSGAPSPALGLVTYQDLLATSPEVKVELIDGVLYTMSGAAANHQLAVGEIFVELSTKFGRRAGSWLILSAPEVHIGRPVPETLVLIPDLAGWQRLRLPDVPEVQGIQLVPDWVCEVLSPGNAWYDRGLKQTKYAGAGVAWLWLANPRERTVEVYKLDGETYRLWQVVAHAEAATIAPFDGIELDMREWWIRGGPMVVAESGSVQLEAG